MLSRRRLMATGLATWALAGVAAADHEKRITGGLPEAFMPRKVHLNAGLQPWEIHVAPDEYALYWTLPGGMAMRYAVGIGREGLYEPGIFFVGAKKEWPSWTPTPDMIAREPQKYARFANGRMPGGIDNPLGARALYLFTPERGDTFLRIHGTNEPDTIGRAVSNGCARLMNDQMIELYDEVPLDTRVVLYRQRNPQA